MLNTIKSWFPTKNKKNVVLYTEPNGELLHDLALVKTFTTDTEPKLFNYPASKYKLYWETLLNTIEGGYSATINFYGYNGMGFVSSVQIIKTSIPALKHEVNTIILTTMEQSKR